MILSGWESVFFWIFAMAALFAAILTILARNAVYSALFLISSLVSIAALFILLGAEFIAGVQILVYVGGVMVLFLFVIMLVNVGAEEAGNEEIFNSKAQVTASVVLSLLLLTGFVYAINRGSPALSARAQSPSAGVSAQNERLSVSATGAMRISKDTERIGGSLYRYASLPFEVASVLLIVAIVGSVMLARTPKQEAVVGDLELPGNNGKPVVKSIDVTITEVVVEETKT
jgi:NADH-quinone oxidoreductase subunit J